MHPYPLDEFECEDLEVARAMGRLSDDEPADVPTAAPRMNPNQFVRPTATQYLDSIQHHINVLRTVHDGAWQPLDLGQLFEVDGILENVCGYFEDLDAERHEPCPDDHEPEV